MKNRTCYRTTLLLIGLVVGLFFQTASAVPFRVGHPVLTGQLTLMQDIVDSAQADLDISVSTSSALDAAFFNSIDAFVMANAAGNTPLNLNLSQRTNLLAFVNSGGHAYLGLDNVFAANGNEVADLFGFTLGNRTTDMRDGTI